MKFSSHKITANEIAVKIDNKNLTISAEWRGEKLPCTEELHHAERIVSCDKLPELINAVNDYLENMED